MQDIEKTKERLIAELNETRKVVAEYKIERKRAEEALRTSEERLSLALEAAGQSIYDSNLKTGDSIVSPEYALLLGYDPAEFHETTAKWLERLHPDDREPVAAVYRAYVKGKIPEYKVEFRQKTKDGDWKWILSLAKIIERDAAGKPLRMIGTLTDITDRKQAEEKISYLATHDALTNLPTLRLVKDRILMAMEMAKRMKTLAAIIYINLEGFKAVNNNYGYEAGDLLLKEVGKRLVSSVRKVDTVARIGGDEFLLVITGLQSPAGAAVIAKKILQLVSQPIDLDGKHSTVGANIGIALYPDHGDDADSLIKQAENALFHKELVKKERRRHELEIAAALQKSFLPASPFLKKSNVTINAVNISAAKVGGDLYDFIEPAENMVGVIIGDVSGKGFSGALYMSKLISHFKYVGASMDSPEKVLNRLNILLADAPHGMFVTVIYMIIDTKTGMVRVSAAGHPPFLLLTKDHVKVMDVLSGPPIGIVPAEYPDTVLQIEAGDRLFLFTDGVFEAKNKTGERIGYERFVEFVRMHRNASSLSELVINYVNDFSKDTEMADDLTMVEIAFANNA